MLKPHEALTDREREILTCLVDGLSNAEIAAQLHLAVQTIKGYNSEIYSKLGVKNRREAIEVATEQGLLDAVESPEKIRHNLPSQTTPFIGREKELSELSILLHDENIRLITILATGGMGKTRLALEVASRLVQSKNSDFADGIFFVPLLPLSESQHIVSQIAHSVGYQFIGDSREPKQQLLAYLAEKQLLLVMDNWEHLLEGVSLVTDILHVASNIRILATSREKLNLSGETVYNLKSMDFPTWETSEDALEYDAVQLLLQAAQRIKADWTVTSDNLDYVARICRLTEGMPLGIVLAASWLDTLSLKNIATEIERSLDFLETEMRDVPQRQHSIRAIFEYSWNRLRKDEQQVFVKLSVFRGGFTWDAAQEVAGAAVRTLQALVNKALVTRDNTGRYDIHELLRQYAEEQLNTSGQLNSIHDTHAQFFADFLHQRDAALKGQQQVETIREIEAEFENVRRMWNKAIETKSHNIFYKSAETLCWYCYIGLHLTEGEQLFDAARTSLEHELNNIAVAHTWSHLQLRLFWIRMSRYGIPKPYDVVMRRVEQWHEFAQDADNKTDIALSNCFLGAIAVLAEQDNTLTLLEESLTRFQQLDNAFYCAWALFNLYSYWENRDVVKSLVYQHEALAIRHELGGRHALGQSLFCVSLSELELGNLEVAVKYAQEMLDLTVARLRYSWISALLADIVFLQGDFDLAQEESVKALAAYTTTRQNRIKEFSLMKLGMVACMDGNFRQAMDYYEQALGTNPVPRHLYYFNWLLGLAACGLDDYPRAIKANHDALTISVQIGAVGRVTWCLPAIVMIEMHNSNTMAAVQFLSLAFNHPKSATGWLEKWSLMGELKDQLKEELGEVKYEKVWEESKNLDLVQVVSGWLAENE